MTLILSALTQDFVVQVSDRRLTDLATGAPKNESANKAIVCCGHVVFGYTGLADINREKTDQWFGRTFLGGVSAQAAIERVRDSATQVFSAVPLRWRMHAFVGVGWSRSRPILVVVSNFLDADGNTAQVARDTFSIDAVRISAPLRIHSAGQRLDRKVSAELVRNAKRAIKRGGGANSVARLLVEQVRQVAQVNQKVGEDVMVSIIPRVAVPLPRLEFRLNPSTPSDNEAAFFYVRRADDYTPRLYVPLWACGGIAIGSGEVWVGEQPPPWWKA
jgi:hypothetical protein